MQRQPIVSVLGHVDHGKTTLLDSIRKTNVALREAGGITQSIGASVITTKEGKKITFIDTPGHAAFEKMRGRGARVADIAVLVVAADDGVKPQTIEAIRHINEAQVPFVVALTKTDLPTANVELTLGQLEKEEILFEGRGGQTSYVSVSGKTGEGIEELLEIIVLLAEVTGIEADVNAPLEAAVIETSKDKRGSLVSVVVLNGKLTRGAEVISGGVRAKVRGLFGNDAKAVNEVLPGDPVQILGFTELPPVGSLLKDTTQDKIETQSFKQAKIPKVKEGQIPVVVKARNAGALEALEQNLPDNAVVISAGVGDVADRDIFMAKSTGAIVLAFESKVPSAVRKLADTEEVQVHTFDIIYELVKMLEDLIEQGKEVVLGKADILASFPYNSKNVAGGKVMMGSITNKDRLTLKRGEKVLGSVRVKSLRKGKDEVAEVKAGEEFGLIFEPQLDFQAGDVLISVAQ